MDDPPALTPEDLDDEQRAWVPDGSWSAYEQWPKARKIELIEGSLWFTGGAADWDWRSVALAARAYPGWRVALESPGWLTVTPPGMRVPDWSTGSARERREGLVTRG